MVGFITVTENLFQADINEIRGMWKHCLMGKILRMSVSLSDTQSTWPQSMAVSGSFCRWICVR